MALVSCLAFLTLCLDQWLPVPHLQGFQEHQGQCLSLLGSLAAFFPVSVAFAGHIKGRGTFLSLPHCHICCRDVSTAMQK